MQPQGTIFRYWCLGEVLFKSDLPGAVFEVGLYYLGGKQNKVYFNTFSLAVYKINQISIDLICP